MKRLFIFILTGIFVFAAAAVPGYAATLQDAQRLYLRGRYDEAIDVANRVRANDESLYFLGLAHVKIGEYLIARNYFRKLIKAYPSSGLKQEAMIKVADTYFLSGHYSEASELYKEIRRRYPDSDNMPLVLLRLAQIASKNGDWEKKKEYLSIIKSRYPKSAEIKFAEVLEGYGDYFTIQVGAFSEKDNALGVEEELSPKYDVYILTEHKDDYTIYKVRIGKFRDRPTAESISSSLKEQGYPARIYP